MDHLNCSFEDDDWKRESGTNCSDLYNILQDRSSASCSHVHCACALRTRNIKQHGGLFDCFGFPFTKIRNFMDFSQVLTFFSFFF